MSESRRYLSLCQINLTTGKVHVFKTTIIDEKNRDTKKMANAQPVNN